MKWTEDEDKSICMLLDGISILSEEIPHTPGAIIRRLSLMQDKIQSVEKLHMMLDDLGMEHDVSGICRRGKEWWIWINHEGKAEDWNIEDIWLKHKQIQERRA